MKHQMIPNQVNTIIADINIAAVELARIIKNIIENKIKKMSIMLLLLE